jgi:predicted nucleic acid-binding protein
MSVLVDTNLLTRSLQPGSPHFPAATTALRELNRRGERLCVGAQNVYEFWAVCTRPPGENGLGLSVAQAGAEQAKVLSLFNLLPDVPAIFSEWQRLVVQHDVKGKNAHDARIVAAMTVHGIGTILTFNSADFARYPGLTVLSPQSFVTSGQP